MAVTETGLSCTHTAVSRDNASVVLLRPLMAAVSLLSACSFQGGFDGTGYRCGTGGTCPSGYVCVDGYCRLPGDPDGGPEIDSAGDDPDGAIPSARCGNLSLLTDDFADDKPGLQWESWADTGASTAETGGYLAVQLTAGAGDVWGGYTSSALYDLTDGTLAAEVSQIGGGATVLEIRHHEGARAQLTVQDQTNLVAAVYGVIGGAERVIVPYDPDQHRHWRMRERDGTLHWETSAGGSSWAALHAEPVPFAPEHVWGIVSAGYQLAAASEARFEEVNPEPANAGFCATETLVDDFAAAPVQPLWGAWSAAGCAIGESGGALVVNHTGAGNVWCGAASTHILDLTDSSLVVEVAEAAVAPMYINYAQVIVPGYYFTRVEIGMENGNLWFEQLVDNVVVDTASVTWEVDKHRFWRFSESGGRLLVHTSSDGTTWTEQLDATPAFDLSRIQVVVAAGAFGTGPLVPVTTRFAGVNAP